MSAQYCTEILLLSFPLSFMHLEGREGPRTKSCRQIQITADGCNNPPVMIHIITVVLGQG